MDMFILVIAISVYVYGVISFVYIYHDIHKMQRKSRKILINKLERITEEIEKEMMNKINEK